MKARARRRRAVLVGEARRVGAHCRRAIGGTRGRSSVALVARVAVVARALVVLLLLLVVVSTMARSRRDGNVICRPPTRRGGLRNGRHHRCWVCWRRCHVVDAGWDGVVKATNHGGGHLLPGQGGEVETESIVVEDGLRGESLVVVWRRVMGVVLLLLVVVRSRVLLGRVLSRVLVVTSEGRQLRPSVASRRV